MGQFAVKHRLRMRELTILSSVVAATAVFGYLNPRFLSVESARSLLEGVAEDGLMVIGMTIVIVCGAFDMSVGSAQCFCGLVAALAMNYAGLPVALAVLAALGAGTLIGWVNGATITRLKINPFITTLGMMSILRGLVYVITSSWSQSGFPKSFGKIAWGTLCKIPLPGDSVLEIRFPLLLFVAGVIAGDLLLRRLRYLRQVYFVGSNEEAARLTGIPTARVKTMAFMVTGLLAAMAGVISTSRVDAVDANGGMGAELRVIAAVIVGGASLSGGRGTILGSFFGLLLMQIIKNGLTFIDVPAEAHFIASGLVLILAAVIDQSGSSLVSLLFKQRNKRMERVINIVLVLALIGGVAFHFATRHDRAVGPAGPPEESTAGQHYEMISFITGGPYWLDSKAGLYDKAKELGVHAVFTGPPVNDVNKQIEAIHTAIAKKVDGMIVVPISDGVAPAINKAIEAGIPVVTADNDAPASNRYTYVGTGNFNAGYLGGEQLAELLGKRGEVALMYIPGCDNLIKRVEGYKAALAKYPDMKIVKIGNDQGSQTEAEKTCGAILQAYPNLAGFGCVAAIGGQGAAVAVKQAGKSGKVKIVAMDRDDATLQFIQEGVIDASVAQRTYTMPYLALQMLYDLRNDRIKFNKDWRTLGINPLPREIDTGCFIINRDNVVNFVRRQKYGPFQ
ncbi:MAG: substrate-binding domain-containing protein [Thermoguttaceae bacterium]